QRPNRSHLRRTVHLASDLSCNRNAPPFRAQTCPTTESDVSRPLNAQWAALAARKTRTLIPTALTTSDELRGGPAAESNARLTTNHPTKLISGTPNQKPG